MSSSVRAALAGLVLAPLGWGASLGADAVLHGTTVVRIQPAMPPDDAGPSSAQLRLSPAAETQLADFIAKARVEKEKVWNQRMTSEIAAIVEVTGLDAAHAKALEVPARQAAAGGLDAWTDKVREQLRTELFQMPPENAAQVLQQVTAQVAVIAKNDWSASVTPPFASDGWEAALRQTLTADQAAAWSKAQADRQADILKQVADPLKAAADRMHDQQLQEAMSACHEIELALKLPKDRSDKLEALAQDVSNQTRELWRKRAENMLLDMTDDQRHVVVANGNIFIGLDPNDFPTRQPAWKQGLAAILTPDEMTRYQGARDDRKAKQVHAMGLIMVTILDDRVALSEEQRLKLEPLAEHVVAQTPALLPDGGQNNFYALQVQLFLSTAATIPEADVKSILAADQFKHWQELTKPESPPNADEKGDPSVGTGEPEDVEREISLFLFDKAETERKRLIEEDLLKVEDVARAVKLGADETSTLEAAARGTAEESLATWRWFAEQQLRGQLQNDLTPQNVRQRLASLQDFFMQRNFFVNRGNRPTIWDATVNSALTPPQLALWKKETDARTAYRDQAVASLVLTQFDQKYHLSEDQWLKLEPIISGVVADYSTDITQMFSGGNSPPWYLVSQFSLMPLVGVPDTDLKAILTKEQMDLWTGSQDCTNGTSWWNNIKQIHKQRTDAGNP